MTYQSNYGKYLSTGVISKAKHALGLKKKKPINKTTYSTDYWTTVCMAIGHKENISPSNVQNAINSYREYV